MGRFAQAALPQSGDGAFESITSDRVQAPSASTRTVLEDKAPSEGVNRARKRPEEYWDRMRPQLSTVFKDTVEITGDWRVEVDDKGSDSTMHPENRFRRPCQTRHGGQSLLPKAKP